MSIRLGAVLAEHSRHLRYEPTAKRVRAVLGGRIAADSEGAVLVWEPGNAVPSYAVPRDHIRVRLGEARAADGPLPRAIRGTAVALSTGDGEEASGFIPDDPELSGFVILDFAGFDSWLEEDDEIQGHPRDPFHRIDIRATSRPIRIALNGDVLADTTTGKLLFETRLATRYYIPRADVLPELLPSPKHTRCPYKGEASYWSFTTKGQVVKDLVWSYETPLPDAAGLDV